MKVVILAGGRATRLPCSAKNIPKVLVEVAGKSILQHQIDGLVKHGFFDIRLALGYRAEQIIEWLTDYRLQQTVDSSRLSVDWLIESEPLDTGGAIKFASKDLKEPFMVLNGDILSDINFSNFYKKFEKRPEENLLTAFHTHDASSYGIIKKEKGRISSFLEKPSFAKATEGRPFKPVAGYINAGFYILSPKVFKNIKEEKFSIEKDIFPKLAKEKKLAYYTHKGFWTDAGTEERLKDARKYFHIMQINE